MKCPTCDLPIYVIPIFVAGNPQEFQCGTCNSWLRVFYDHVEATVFCA